ncbi:MAG: helix-turn-helix domain-containing protein [Candidatus Woesearchaeota archaeon]|jgi:sugar-specific transcriptional regulator TrmB
MDEFIAALVEYGLSQKEAEIYLTCLKTGPSTANRLSSLADFRRSTTYDILESLKAKGIISSFIREKKLFFQAANPEELISLLKSKQDKISTYIPQLKKLSSTVLEKPKVLLFEGMKGIISLFDELYRGKELFIYGSAKKADEFLFHLPESMARRRVEQKIILKAVFEKSEFSLFRLKDPEIRKFTQIRFLSEMEKFPTVTFISGHKVGIISLSQELIGTLIIDEEISQSQRLVFEGLWNRAKLK